MRSFRQVEFITRLNRSSFKDAVIPSTLSRTDNNFRHFLVVETVSEFPAWLSALAYLKDGRSERKPITDADVIFSKTACGNVLPERSRLLQKGMACQFSAPEGVVIDGIVMDRLI